MNKLRTIVTDTYDFATLIRDRNVYVDKTALLHRLISRVDGSLFFMSRPRRFGKSLMISTLEQIFSGKKSLFKGLAIAKSDYDWKTYPVLRLDMSQVRDVDATRCRRILCSLVADVGLKYGLDLSSETNPGRALGRLLDVMASEGRRVAVLIDEYDAPIGGLLDRPKLLAEVRGILHDFYLMLKVKSEEIHFLMMTGVSKFTKLSVFSGMNNLTDISMSENYASLLGYTRDEVERNFKPHIKAFADKLKTDSTSIVEDLMSWYDSYRFSPECETRVSNPVSIGRALQERRFYGFWDATGSATLIVERLRKLGRLPDEIEGIKVFPKKLDVCDVKTLPFAALMYQGGYLTIKDVAPSGELVMGIPNREVRLAIYDGLVENILKDSADPFTSAAVGLKRLLEREGTADCLERVLKSVFAMIPHEWKLKSEAEAKRYFLLFMKLAGAAINAEVESSNGRADAILETERMVLIFEFKYRKSVRAALKQCHDRQYALPYANDARQIVYVGVNYDTRKRNVDTLNDTLNDTQNDTLNDTLNSRLVALVRQCSGVRRPELMAMLGVSESTVARCLRKLQSRVEFRGAAKTGGYYLKGE